MNEPQRAPGAAIVTIGDELLTGRVQDAHSAYLSQALARARLETDFHLSVGDAPGALSERLQRMDHAGPTLIVGGLGPTEDDRTRSEVARALGVPLEFDETSWRAIQAFFSERAMAPSENNRRQAYFPRGATVISNAYGTAPAFRIDLPDRHWWVLPGVPRELQALLADPVLAEIVERYPPAGGAMETTALEFFAVPEARLDEWLVGHLSEAERSRYHICVTDGETHVELPPVSGLEAEARATFGHRFLGAGSGGLAFRVLEEAKRQGAHLVLAESCTGGMVARRIVDVPGASQVFEGSWVVYSYEQKTRALGVTRELLEAHGAVSAEVACAMAQGARDRGGPGPIHALAITGVAGPGGGTDEKPVGTTFLAVANPAGVWWRRFRFPGDRDRVRAWSTHWGLFALWLSLVGGEDFGQSGVPPVSTSDGFGAGALGWQSSPGLD